MLSSYQLQAASSFSSDLFHEQGFHVFTGHFLLFRPNLETQRQLWEKIPLDQQFLQYSKQPIWEQQPQKNY